MTRRRRPYLAKQEGARSPSWGPAVATTDLTGLANTLVREDLGPGVPLYPVHPEKVQPRRWDYQPGYNIPLLPRSWETIGFAPMRQLAEAWDVFNVAIERNIDDFRELDWEIRPKVIPGMERREAKDRAKTLLDTVQRVTGFWQTPDQEHSWGAWVHGYLDELYKTDAACLYIRKTETGDDLYGVEWVSGATIKPIVDAQGRRPEPPQPAYQQVIRGLPWTDYVRDMQLPPHQRRYSYDRSILLYEPFWPKVTSPYGNPPLLWLLLTVQRALTRQMLDFSLYADGTIPHGFWKVPAEWTETQRQELQTAWDQLVNAFSQRATMRFMPGGPGLGYEAGFIEPKTEGEEWLLHLAYIALKRSPMKDGILRTGSAGLGGAGMAQEQGEAANRGLKTLAKHVAAQITRIINQWQSPELEIVFPAFIDSAEDTLKEAQTEDVRIRNGSLSLDEARAVHDLDPVLAGLTDGPTNFVMSGTGPIPLAQIFAPPLPPELPVLPPGDVERPPVPPEGGAPAPGRPGPAPETPSAAPGQNTEESSAGSSSKMGKRVEYSGNLAKTVYRYLLRSYPADDVKWVLDPAIHWEFDRHVPLDSINMARRPGGRNPEKVGEIADTVGEGASMDPVVLVEPDGGTPTGRLAIADGWHRTLGAEKAGAKDIPALIGHHVPDEYRDLWADEMQADSSSVQKAADLRRWRAKAVKAARAGRPAAVPFTSEAIDAPTAAFVRDALAKAADPADVNAVFDLVKAGAPASPFDAPTRPASSAVSGRSGPPSSGASRGGWYARWD